MSGGLIPSPPQLCSHVCQLHCLLMLMRILPESILLVIHIISLLTAKTSNKACDIGFTITKFYTRCELMMKNEMLGTCHMCQQALQKYLFFLSIHFSYIYSKSLARAICVNKPNKKIMICASDASSACRSVGLNNDTRIRPKLLQNSYLGWHENIFAFFWYDKTKKHNHFLFRLSEQCWRWCENNLLLFWWLGEIQN